MRRFTLLLVPLLVITLCVWFIYATEGRHPPAWQRALNDYVGTIGTPVVSQQAWYPQVFDSAAFRVVDYGEFEVPPGDFPAPNAAAPTSAAVPVWNIASGFRSVSDNQPVIHHQEVRNNLLDEQGTISQVLPVQRLALPASPKNVYCVLLKQGEERRLLFVNYYSDNLWHAGWVIHDGGSAPFAQKTVAMLADLGCNS